MAKAEDSSSHAYMVTTARNPEGWASRSFPVSAAVAGPGEGPAWRRRDRPSPPALDPCPVSFITLFIIKW